MLVAFAVWRWKPHWNVEEYFNPVLFFYGITNFPRYGMTNFFSAVIVSFFL